jgi:uncharacterized protein YbbC (DUF1343 family)
MVGAPFIDSQILSDAMNSRQLAGVRFTAVYFKPTASKHAGTLCGGVHAHVTDLSVFRPVQTGIVLLGTIRTLYSKEFQFLPAQEPGRRPFIEYLAGGDLLTSAIMDTQSIIARCERESLGFAQHKIQYHLYP